MDLASATASLREKVGTQSGLNTTLKFDCGDEGVVLIDGSAEPNTVDNHNRDAACTVALNLSTLGDLIAGRLEPTTGFMTGRFKVSGDTSVALKLQRVL